MQVLFFTCTYAGAGLKGKTGRAFDLPAEARLALALRTVLVSYGLSGPLSQPKNQSAGLPGKRPRACGGSPAASASNPCPALMLQTGRLQGLICGCSPPRSASCPRASACASSFCAPRADPILLLTYQRGQNCVKSAGVAFEPHCFFARAYSQLASTSSY